MARVTVKIPWVYRSWLFLVLLVSWCSGLAFFIMNRWITVEGDFGPEKHPWQFDILKIHGAAAFLMMIFYGYLLASHMPAGLKAKRERVLGLSLVAAQGVMILTAYLLYYSAGEKFREVVGYAHLIVGVTFPFLLLAHVVSGRRRKS
ncbi:hypothetical protein [Luteolibacter sp. AS25]|uniref:hypothetical protein n=1 Tax=Luteolibacter sp. AS25 TaxID=3135776 RepID=UPI00398B342B